MGPPLDRKSWRLQSPKPVNFYFIFAHEWSLYYAKIIKPRAFGVFQVIPSLSKFYSILPLKFHNFTFRSMMLCFCFFIGSDYYAYTGFALLYIIKQITQVVILSFVWWKVVIIANSLIHIYIGCYRSESYELFGKDGTRDDNLLIFCVI